MVYESASSHTPAVSTSHDNCAAFMPVSSPPTDARFPWTNSIRSRRAEAAESRQSITTQRENDGKTNQYRQILRKIILDKFRAIDFLGPLMLRLYLVPIFWMAEPRNWVP